MLEAEHLAGIAHLPTLILWADADPGFGTPHRFEGLFPKHRTVVLKNVGHFLEEDAPDEVAEAILRWWAEEVGSAEPAIRS